MLLQLRLLQLWPARLSLAVDEWPQREAQSESHTHTHLLQHLHEHSANSNQYFLHVTALAAHWRAPTLSCRRQRPVGSELRNNCIRAARDKDDAERAHTIQVGRSMLVVPQAD